MEMGNQDTITTGMESRMTRILALAKVPTSMKAKITLTTLSILLLPVTALNLPHLQTIRVTYASYLGIAFVVSLLLLTLRGIEAYWRYQKSRPATPAN